MKVGRWVVLESICKNVRVMDSDKGAIIRVLDAGIGVNS
jgi:hypothetical protein